MIFLSFFLLSMCTYEHTYEHIHICVHSLLGTDNTSCNLQRYCIERRSPVPFRMEGSPPWSLYSAFSCFSAGQSLLFPPNDQTILNVYTMHLRLNGNLCSALARSHSFHSVQRLAKYKWCRFLICSFYPDPPSDFLLVVFRIYCITITQRKTHLGLCLSDWQAHWGKGVLLWRKCTV